jgi:dihydroorotase
MDVVVEGQAYFQGRLIKCCIGIDEGKISEVKKIIKGDKNFDYGDKLILPGAIDSHVHFRDPGFTHKEDFSTGSIAAAFGGVTCVLDMPNTNPQTTNADALREKIRIASSKSFVDFGMFAGITEKCDIESLSKHATAFKIYLASTTGDMYIEDNESLKNLFSKIENTGKTVAVHCEDNSLMNMKIQATTLLDHLKSRPNESERSGILRAISMAGRARLHLCHVSTKEGVELIRSFKSDDLNCREILNKNMPSAISNPILTSEVTPHHLFLNTDSDVGAFGKVNPPLRTPEDQDALWQALKEGLIDTIASDHAPHTLEEKENFQKALSGMPGVETMLPLMLYRVKHDRFDMHRLIDAICTKPSIIYGLNKGAIEPGMDGDLIVVDMREEREIKGEELHSKCGWTAFEGLDGVFPRSTFVRGEQVIRDWSIEGDVGFGDYVNTKKKS